jgi:hypothetical protein
VIGGWNDFNVSGVSISQGSPYWLVFNINNSGDSIEQGSGDGVSPYEVSSTSYGVFPSNFGGVSDNWGEVANMRINYTSNPASTSTTTSTSTSTSITTTSETSTITSTSVTTTILASTTDLIGGTSHTDRGWGSSTHLFAWKLVSASESGTLQSMGINFASASGTAYLAIYGDVNGHPGALLGNSTIGSVTGGWNDFNVSGVSISQGSPYWLVFDINNSDDAIEQGSGDGVSPYETITSSYGVFPSNFGGSSDNWGEVANMRITYVS